MTPRCWVYLQSERAGEYGNCADLYTVGFYGPGGKWHPESDHNTRDAAAARVHYLNGGRYPDDAGGRPRRPRP